MRERHRLELSLADDARERTWPREVERHCAIARRIEQLLADLGEEVGRGMPCARSKRVQRFSLSSLGLRSTLINPDGAAHDDREAVAVIEARGITKLLACTQPVC
jgi:hypothetical protein